MTVQDQQHQSDGTETPPPAPPAGEPPASDRTFTQVELDRMISDRLDRERKKYADFDQIKQKAQKLDDIEAENASELEKAVKAARGEERAAVLREYAEQSARFAAKAQLEARLGKDAAAELLDDINISKYVNDDGSVDEDGIGALAARLAPAAPPPNLHQGRQGKPSGRDIDAEIQAAQASRNTAAVIALKREQHALNNPQA